MSYNKPGFKNVYEPKISLLNFLQRQESPEKMVQSIVDDLINLSIEISVRLKFSPWVDRFWKKL